ncbi:MAG: hypothetical protein OXL34_08200 [Gemmatimonadota bacterium]|nr:hypothetical protein [Gemmatimonadota bacterium]
MTWPAWGDVLPALALLVGLAGSIAGAFWALMRMFQPVADRAARDAVDGLYDRLKANDFKHVEDGLRALGDRIDRMREDFGGRLDRSDNRLKDGLDRMREEVGERLKRADQRFEDGLDRMREEVGNRLAQSEQRVEGWLGRARKDQEDMEARLLAAIQGVQ